MTSHAKKKMIAQCGEKEGESGVTIDMKVGLQSKVITELIKPALLVDLEEIVVVLPDIKLSTMLKAVTYLTRHIELSEKVSYYFPCHVEEHECLEAFDGYEEELEDIEAFDDKFIDVDPGSLFLLSHAANYLKIKSLMDLTCKTLSSKIKGKTQEEIEEAVKKWKSMKRE